MNPRNFPATTVGGGSFLFRSCFASFIITSFFLVFSIPFPFSPTFSLSSQSIVTRL